MELKITTDHVAGIIESNGTFSGSLKQFGCRNCHRIKFSGRINEKVIYAEFFTSANGNPPELAAKKLCCELPIMSDGSFGGTDMDESRFWLRYRPSGGPKYQWLSGKVSADHIHIKLTFGSPKFSSSYCHAEGLFLKHTTE